MARLGFPMNANDNTSTGDWIRKHYGDTRELSSRGGPSVWVGQTNRTRSQPPTAFTAGDSRNYPQKNPAWPLRLYWL